MRKLIPLLVLACLFSVGLQAQLVNPNPGVSNPAVEKTYKDGFVDVFGPRPFGPRDHQMKQRQMVWDMQHERFDRLVDEEFPVSVFLTYEQIGIGLPVKWREKGGAEFVAFPEARYFRPVYMPVSTAKDFPGVVWRTWHLDSVAKGFCVPELHPNFPAVTVAQNAANCSAVDPPTVSQSILTAPFRAVGDLARALF